MKKIAPLAIAATALLTLSACGSTTDASEDAMADTVEMPADQALAGTPEPAMDEDAVTDAADAASGDAEIDAMEAAAAAEGMVNEDVEAAIGSAESSME
ncbi:hypothetical protein GCM10009127_03550 [Alteraurantiacibacter aestuarii]|uniref:Circumsporozoite protein n=1 Tax=Alteraurantiacibacter aestuarii TaxID=650004 RepID=A0A844ZIT2_9SPHN|nr:hypothetical protein [Alteraurantiacibacter aestuarii]MXO88391.1 hypothetical protein [Alteraurantiacibacter aestuarii]